MLLKQFFPYLCRFNEAAMENNNSPIPLSQAVEAIKTAILQGQYEALKDVNRVQLAVYFAIGKYLSKNTRKGVWGTGALKKISEQLRKELPGLRGYSETNLKNMRLFYDHWQMLDSNSSVATDELISAIPIAENNNSSVVTDESRECADIDIAFAVLEYCLCLHLRKSVLSGEPPETEAAVNIIRPCCVRAAQDDTN